MSDQEKVRCPRCPMCGRPPIMAFGGPTMVPVAFCGNDDCDVFSWDYTLPAWELIWGGTEQIIEQSSRHAETDDLSSEEDRS